MWKFLKLVPPWAYVGAGALAVTVMTGVGAYIYQRAVTSTLTSVREQIFNRYVWQTEVNMAMDRVTLEVDQDVKTRLEANEKKWRTAN